MNASFFAPFPEHDRLLFSRHEFSNATHRISAYIAEDGDEACDDDGEVRAGGSLRSVLRKEKVLGAVVVVARWYGGVNIGPWRCISCYYKSNDIVYADADCALFTGKARFQHVESQALSLLKAIGQKEGQPLSQAYWQHAGPGGIQRLNLTTQTHSIYMEQFVGGVDS